MKFISCTRKTSRTTSPSHFKLSHRFSCLKLPLFQFIQFVKNFLQQEKLVVNLLKMFDITNREHLILKFLVRWRNAKNSPHYKLQFNWRASEKRCAGKCVKNVFLSFKACKTKVIWIFKWHAEKEEKKLFHSCGFMLNIPIRSNWKWVTMNIKWLCCFTPRGF